MLLVKNQETVLLVKKVGGGSIVNIITGVEVGQETETEVGQKNGHRTGQATKQDRRLRQDRSLDNRQFCGRWLNCGCGNWGWWLRNNY